MTRNKNITAASTAPSVPFVRGGTKVIGVFGHPVTHSLSPAMHNAALAALALPFIYVPFPVAPEELGTALRALHALGIVGVNLTIPHKEAALPFLDEITQEARDVGAVNTIHCIQNNCIQNNCIQNNCIQNNCIQNHPLRPELGGGGGDNSGDYRLLGDNTDGFGFYEPLREMGFELAAREVVVLGAGGAARSVAFRLARQGARLCLVNRTRRRAELLAQALADAGLNTDGLMTLSPEDPALKAALSGAALLVNTTRVGMVPEHLAPPPVPAHLLHPDLLVYDLVYNPVETELLKQARTCGCRTMTGVKMLVYQGAAAFQRWTGHWPPTEIMEEAVLRGLLTC